MKDIFLISSPEIPRTASRRDILLILLVVLAVYFPAVSGQVNSIDDVHILAAYEGGGRTLLQILSPDWKFYYRPLIEFSYFLDDLMWNLDPRMMHLENILLHLSNATLVYLITKKLSACTGFPGVPLVASLLFAIHPVQTEAVSWIAGRTDPLAGSFILLTLYFYLRVKESGNRLDFAIAAVMAVCSLLTKETAAALLPVLLLFENKVTVAGPEHTTKPGGGYTGYAILVAAIIIVGVVAGVAILAFSGSTALGTFLTQDFEWRSAPFNVLKSIGFYFSKFFFPYPLNFAVNSVSGWFAPVGAVSILIVLYAASKKSVVCWAVISAFLFMLPAVAAGIAGINWTPVAERYMYIPTAFLAIASSAFFPRFFSDNRSHRGARILIIFAAILIALTTFNRNIVWRSNEALYRDAVNKSPDFGDAHLELGVALSKLGRFNEAVYHFQVAERLSKRPKIREHAGTNLLFCSIQKKEKYEQRKIISQYVVSKQYVPTEVMQMWRNLDQRILSEEKDPNRRVELMNEIIVINDRLFRETRDAACLYTNAQFFLALKNHEKALEFFRKSVAEAPSDAYYLDSARRMTAKLERKQ